MQNDLERAHIFAIAKNMEVGTMANINGTDAGESLIGTSATDNISGQGGDDFIYAGENTVDAFDDIDAGSGNDTILISGQGYVYGRAGNDRIIVIDNYDPQNNFVVARYDFATTSIVGNFSAGSFGGLAGGTNTNGFLVQDGEGGIDRVSGVSAIQDGAFNDQFIVDSSYTMQYGNHLEVRLSAGDDTVQFINVDAAVISYKKAGGAVTLDLEAGTATDRISGQTFIGHDTFSGANIARGSAFDDLMYGFNGDDFRLRGSEGNDTIHGRGGNDTIEGDDSDVPEWVGNDTLYGDAGNDTIRGNGGNDLLDGGIGADNMQGGIGNDSYYVDNAGDHVIEVNGQGIDNVQAYVSFSLSGQELENLALRTGASINGTGNSIANIITGNSGDNVIDGLGGADTMSGSTGNDTYYVDNAGDHVVELNGQGTDNVQSYVSFNLSGQELENLALRSTGNINGTGNSIANIITGNSGANVINGLLGNDTLSGSTGNDTFVFTTALNASTNVDHITDFSVVEDTIQVDNAIFAALGGNGTLTANQFVKNSTGLAGDSDDHIIYETDTGWLYYDSNGSAAGGSTHFATLAANLALTNADFVVV
ncbi:calcium-binding protein [Mesorhizobium kowhaii]|uniref:calcium-binding protein n=1 Tax=Mesorhizobium kowhaii TaxID=1300272 RepID=UPI0035EE551D